MGFDADQVQAQYGHSLAGLIDAPLTFNVRFHARLGEMRRWKSIDLDRIVLPPPQDFAPRRAGGQVASDSSAGASLR